MNRIFELKNAITRKQNSALYKIFNSLKTDDNVVYNLTNKLIPFNVKAVLSLGLKFSFPISPNLKQLKVDFEEALRKIGWRCFFLNNEIPTNDSKSFFRMLTKNCKEIGKFHSEVEAELFSPNLPNNFIHKINENRGKQSSIFLKLLESFKEFVLANDFIIKEADKNAGICIMNRADYELEIINQLSDENFYHSTTYSEYNYRMDFLNEDILANIKRFPSDCNLKSMLNSNHNPAKFYILPKMHKSYDKFPKGRPISSTIGTLNRPCSKILDAYLQPIMNFVPDVILDSTHFILLLENVRLDPNKKYTMVTIDVDSLYTNLKISDCKKHCSMYFSKYSNLLRLPCTLNKYQINKLLQWSLSYSYIEFNKQYFFQHKGIQMGNCASVVIANITVYEELRPLFENHDEIVFKCRFIDDLFLIVDSSGISDMNSWCNTVLKHSYLSFTFKSHESYIDFLDLTIMLDLKNCITTKLYTKPTNKHKFLHFKSSHPKHLLKSLPYSCGLRIIRSCSDPKDRDIEMLSLFSKFEQRDYPKFVLQSNWNKLQSLSRDEILKPKKSLLISNLNIHQPSILLKYSIQIDDVSVSHEHSNKVYLVFPFYNTVLNFASLIVNEINKDVCTCSNVNLKKAFESLSLVISYKKSNSLSDYVNNKKGKR